MRIDLKFAAKLLMQRDNVLILTHAHPDADTLGSGFALCRALQALGKQAKVICDDPIPKKCRFMIPSMPEDFSPGLIVAVDIADERLLGEETQRLYGGKTELCIDHHASNKDYATYTLINAQAAAAAEIVYDLCAALGVELDAAMADCLYAGLSTDTGCFLYSNTTAKTHRIAAALIEKGADVGGLNRVFFETKSKAYAALEATAMHAMEFYFGGLCALLHISQKDFARCGATPEDYERIPGLTRQVEGVLIGVAMREQPDGSYKISLRTHEPVDAGEICKQLDGGGHARAAGCTLPGPLKQAKERILETVREALLASGVTDQL